METSVLFREDSLKVRQAPPRLATGWTPNAAPPLCVSSGNLHGMTTGTTPWGRRVQSSASDKEVDAMMWNIGTGWAAWLAMALAMVGVWASLIFGAIAVIRRITESRADDGQPDRDADRILDEEFARGRIGAEEYRARHDVLHPAH